MEFIVIDFGLRESQHEVINVVAIALVSAVNLKYFWDLESRFNTISSSFVVWQINLLRTGTYLKFAFKLLVESVIITSWVSQVGLHVVVGSFVR